ncbi:anaphase-promoting complex subunit 7 [Sitophilus oryzae]|uniref:Anaphase-promoting complex subunit 7 n=1 Tax=Sitophilus oryzae TaxID=7048 RepID=A0A6J2YCH0_SITOR|nr:anaphase-promoting complex subunit 7 [Sitophilus oryzae]
MANLLKHLKTLYEQELYSNLSRTCNLLLTVAEQKPDYLPILVKFQIVVYYADSLYNTQFYSQADNNYRQALQIKKIINNKSRNSNNKIIENQKDISSEVDIKYKIHLCCLALKQRKAAADILQSIPARQRTPKINMALGNIYKEVGMERSAITCFKDVIRECPLALDAIETLLKLGTSGVEVNSLIMVVSSDLPWLSSWIKAQAQFHAREYTTAIQTYKSMDVHGLLKDNSSLLVNMGYCYHYMHDDSKAIAILQKAIRLDPNLTFGRAFLSTLLAVSGNKEHQYTLENLAPSSDAHLWSVEQWIILGNLMYFLKKYEKAVYFAQQAWLMENSKNIEASLLKANSLVQLKKYSDAAIHASEAMQICPYRFDSYKCLVECYINMNRLKEAETVAMTACKEFNYTPQAYCLQAQCLLKESMPNGKNIRRILEKAVTQDKEGTSEALSMLVEFLEMELQHEHAVKILLKALETQKPTSKHYQLLGDCYVYLQNTDEAFKAYTTALKLDPYNQKASDGLGNIGGNTSNPSYSSRKMANSDNEGDAESDTDVWPGSSPNY